MANQTCLHEWIKDEYTDGEPAPTFCLLCDTYLTEDLKVKVIFLDIDGVVNSWDWIDRNEKAGKKLNYRDHFDEEAVKHLNVIVEKTGAKFVLSSTWRLFNTLEYVQDMLVRHGFKGELIDKTPQLRHLHAARGDEIQDWLSKHPEVTKFVIVDDDKDMKQLIGNLVQTSCEKGLLEEHIAPIVKQLND